MSDKYLNIKIDTEELLSIQSEVKELIEKKYSNNCIDTVIAKLCPELKDIIKSHISYGARVALEDFAVNDRCLALSIEKVALKNDNELPDTPIGSFDKKTELSMRCLDGTLVAFMYSAELQPVANISENKGRLIRNVVARLGYEEITSSHGSKASLGFHNDQLNYDVCRKKPFCSFPDVLAFLAIRNNEKVETEILSVESILDGLSYKTVRLLQESAYSFQGPKSTKISPYSPRRVKEPLLLKKGNIYQIRFDPNVVETTCGHDLEHVDALKELIGFLGSAESDTTYCLDPGSILMFKNRLVLHKRKSFDKHVEEKKSRWLRRVYGVRNIDIC